MKFICVGPGAEEELSEMDTEADAEIFLMWVMDGYGSKSMVTIVWGCLGNKHPLASYLGYLESPGFRLIATWRFPSFWGITKTKVQSGTF